MTRARIRNRKIEVQPLPTDRPPTSGELIRFHRQTIGWWQEDLAEALKIKPQTLSRYERGRDLSTEKLRKIADALGKQLSDLLPPEEVDPEELFLTDVFRRASPFDRTILLQTAKTIQARLLHESRTAEFEHRAPRRS